MKFRPCIDLHQGKVKQIVGSTLSDGDQNSLKTNFASEHPPSYYAEMYRRDNLTGGHIIMLGPGNEEAATDALSAWPGGMQVGGGINSGNAKKWLDRGASAVIVTSYVFNNGVVHEEKLNELVGITSSERLIIDLSCREKDGRYYVVTDRWQNFTDVEINRESIEYFSGFCSELLIHAADVEGKCEGVAVELISQLADIVNIPTTYAGGVKDISDLKLVKKVGKGKLDVTIGSALDIFGGTGITYTDAVEFCRS